MNLPPPRPARAILGLLLFLLASLFIPVGGACAVMRLGFVLGYDWMLDFLGDNAKRRKDSGG